jgi:plasmid stabilization system protein ParE
MSLPMFWTDEAKEAFDAIFFLILDKFSEQSAKKI